MLSATCIEKGVQDMCFFFPLGPGSTQAFRCGDLKYSGRWESETGTHCQPQVSVYLVHPVCVVRLHVRQCTILELEECCCRSSPPTRVKQHLTPTPPLTPPIWSLRTFQFSQATWSTLVLSVRFFNREWNVPRLSWMSSLSGFCWNLPVPTMRRIGFTVLVAFADVPTSQPALPDDEVLADAAELRARVERGLQTWRPRTAPLPTERRGELRQQRFQECRLANASISLELARGGQFDELELTEAKKRGDGSGPRVSCSADKGNAGHCGANPGVQNPPCCRFLFIYLLIFEGFPNRVLVYPDRGVSK